MEKARMLGMEQVVVGGTEGGRSPTGVPPTTAAAALGPRPLAMENRCPIRPSRRSPCDDSSPSSTRFASSARPTAATEPGQLGALLRREGLYSSHLSTWRQQRERRNAGRLDSQASRAETESRCAFDRRKRAAQTREPSGWRPSSARPKRSSRFKKNFPRCWGSPCRRPRATGASHEGR